MVLQKYTELEIDLNAKDNIDGKTAFHLMCEFGHTSLVELLIKKSTMLDIEFNAEDKMGDTAFHLACEGGYPNKDQGHTETG